MYDVHADEVAVAISKQFNHMDIYLYRKNEDYDIAFGLDSIPPGFECVIGYRNGERFSDEHTCLTIE